jgi:regulatory subunit for Cdc7p protein kinase
VDVSVARPQSLPALLRDEQLFGTRERDPFVPRPDTHYFSSKTCYVLVEDTTSEHRPIVVKEYDRPKKGEDPSWPVLYGGIEGRGGFYHYLGSKIIYERKKFIWPADPPAVVVPPSIPAGAGGGNFAAVRAVGLTAPNLRRSVSLNQLRKNSINASTNQPSFLADQARKKNKDDEYIAASGNSQIITSNIASGTSSAVNHNQPNRGIIDKRLAILARSVVSLGGPSTSNNSNLSTMKALGGTAGKLKRSASLDAGLSKKLPPPREREENKKPGYCENCRNKYDDFKEVSFHLAFVLIEHHCFSLSSNE